MRETDFHYLLSAEGREQLATLAGAPIAPDSQLALASRLRGLVGPERAQALLEQALLRQRAESKFSRAATMYFTRDGLEQATAEPVAAHRAGRFAEAGFKLVADLGAGLGGDAIALAETASVIALDRDPLRLAMARENAAAYGRQERFLPVAADLLETPPLPLEAFYFDPARRTTTDARSAPSRRLHSVEDYRPPLSLIDRWRPRVPHGAVKVSPAIDYAEIPAESEVEFVSFRGEVREGVLWYGDLRRGERRATLLPGGHALTEADEPGEPLPVTVPRAFLVEPDGAVIRAHLVGALGVRTGATLISPDIAYLTADHPVESPFGRTYPVETWFPFQLKRLRRYLREQGVGQVTIKKRGSPLDPEDLRRALQLRGSAERVLFLTQVLGEPAVIIGFGAG